MWRRSFMYLRRRFSIHPFFFFLFSSVFPRSRTETATQYTELISDAIFHTLLVTYLYWLAWYTKPSSERFSEPLLIGRTGRRLLSIWKRLTLFHFLFSYWEPYSFQACTTAVHSTFEATTASLRQHEWKIHPLPRSFSERLPVRRLKGYSTHNDNPRTLGAAPL